MSTGVCPDCFTGSISTSNPTGTIATIHDLPTYVSSPEDGVKPKGLVIFITDVFGYTLPNSQVLADQYAKKGQFLVYVPDFFGGSALDASALHMMENIMKPASWYTTLFVKPINFIRVLFMAIPFFIKNRSSVVKPRVFKFFQEVQGSIAPFPTNKLKVGAAGFCFGGRYAVLLAHDKPSSRAHAYNPATESADGPLTPLIDCAFTAHPSLLSVPDDVEAVTCPLSVSIGNDDMALKQNLIVEMRNILEKKGDDNECVILPGAKHGFAIRTDPNNEEQMAHAATAEKQAIDWFTRWFS